MITAVVGAQFGSEGKGKISALLSQCADLCVRSGGPNAGHSFETTSGGIESVRMLPSGVASDKPGLAIGAGAVLDLDVLLEEIQRFAVQPTRLTVDSRAIVVQPEDLSSEVPLTQSISSTGKGTGAAAARRILGRGRGAELTLAGNRPELQPYMGDVLQLVHSTHLRGGLIVAEGTQGFGLSLLHGMYPFVTSRDTTASGLCSEIGIPARMLTDVVLVVRTFPIRVAGPSGPLREEIDWETVSRESKSPTPIIEYTTVTKRVRRVGRFDAEVVRRAIIANAPTALALMQVDYLDYSDRGRTSFSDLSFAARKWIQQTENAIGEQFGILSTGPRAQDTIIRHDVLPERLSDLLRRALDERTRNHVGRGAQCH
jgi:adenylosuccinate synthase